MDGERGLGREEMRSVWWDRAKIRALSFVVFHFNKSIVNLCI
jgi:hypothetical protein